MSTRVHLEMLIRYRLSKNPFSREAERSLASFQQILVREAADNVLDLAVSEALLGEGALLVVVAGDRGAGRTLRLKVVREKFEGREGTGIYISVRPDEREEFVFRMVEQSLDASRGLKQAIRRRILSLHLLRSKAVSELGTPTETAELILGSIKSNVPAFLLIDDFYNLYFETKLWRTYVMEMLRHIVSSVPEGVLTAIAVSKEVLDEIRAEQPAFYSRIHEKVELAPLDLERAMKLVAKRISAFRLEDVGDPLYPFTEEFIGEALRLSNGNPEELLRLLNTGMLLAYKAGKHRVDAEVSEALAEVFDVTDVTEKLPEEAKREARFILTNILDREFHIVTVARALEVPPSVEYGRLELLVDSGFLIKTGENRYRLHPRYAEKIGKVTRAILSIR